MNTGSNIGLIIDLEYMKGYKMENIFEKKLTMSKLFDLNHRALRSKKHTKKIYKAVTTKNKDQEIIKLKTVKNVPSYDQTGRYKLGKKITFDSNLSIDTNKEKIAGFTNTIAKLRLIYENSKIGFIKYESPLPRYHTFFCPPYALLDNDLGILKVDFFLSQNIFEYDEMLKLGECINILYEYDFDDNLSWISYGKTADSLEKVINEKIYPGLAKIFDNVPRAVCGGNWESLYPRITFDNKKQITHFTLAHPEKLEVKPEYKEEFEKYKSRYDTSCEAFRIHEL